MPRVLPAPDPGGMCPLRILAAGRVRLTGLLEERVPLPVNPAHQIPTANVCVVEPEGGLRRRPRSFSPAGQAVQAEGKEPQSSLSSGCPLERSPLVALVAGPELESGRGSRHQAVCHKEPPQASPGGDHEILHVNCEQGCRCCCSQPSIF